MEKMQIITYTGKRVTFGSNPRVIVNSGDNLGYKKLAIYSTF